MNTTTVLKTTQLTFTLIILLLVTNSYGQKSCLYKNPLCFYNTDILSYLQALHKNKQYEKMIPFLHGPRIATMDNKTIIQELSTVDFGYTLKRVGIKETSKNNWSITYQRTLLGTNENFKIECTLIKGTCKVYLDKKQWDTIFK